jgi:cell division protein ZapE
MKLRCVPFSVGLLLVGNTRTAVASLIDALYEARCKLLASAAAVPDTLYEHGENAAMFERTASRLNEMQSQDYLAQSHIT